MLETDLKRGSTSLAVKVGFWYVGQKSVFYHYSIIFQDDE